MVASATPSPNAPPAALQATDLLLSRLAHELARDIYPLEDVLKQFNIDADYFNDHVIDHPRFKTLFLEALSVWRGATNAKERVGVKAALMVEEWMPEANRLFHDVQQPLSAKVEAMKLMAKLAGLGEAADKGVAAGERVVVNINLSAAGAPNIQIDKVAEAKTIEGSVQEVTDVA